MEAIVVSMFTRETGIITSLGDSKHIKSISDLIKKGIRIINRQEGSGTRLLLDGLIQKAGIEASVIARNNFFKRQVQALISFLRPDEFKSQANSFDHYDFKCSGMIAWPEV